MPDPHLPGTEKLLADAKPKIHQRLIAALKQQGPKIGQGALMGVFLGGIAAPLATLSAGPVAQIITQIISGVGGNLLANFIQKFYDAETAGDEAVKQNVLAEIVQHLQAESAQQKEILLALQLLIERVEALAAVREAMGDNEAARLQQQFLWLRPIPADIAEHRRFAGEVRKLLRLQGAQIEDGYALGDEHRADFLVTDRLRGRPVRTVVQCVSTKQGRADEAMLDSFLRRLDKAQRDQRLDFGSIISDAGLAPSAQKLAADYGWKVQRYDDLLAELMDFSIYLGELDQSFTQARPNSDFPALQKYYVPQKAGKERRVEAAEAFDLLAHAQNWLNRPGRVPPLMVLGEYGTGKTTFSRMLACKLAQQYLQAQDQAAAGNPAGLQARPRLPLLINLLDFAETPKLEALITFFLSHHCHVAQPSFELFQALNAAGLFVLILDGFDEMAVRVDEDTVEKHLRHLELLAAPEASRVLVTSRPEFFVKPEQLEHALEPSRKRAIYGRRTDYETVWLQLWDDGQVREFLDRLVPLLPNRIGSGQDYFNRIKDIPGFANDLEQRPVLLEMIAQTLPRFDANTPVTRPNLYEEYLKGELTRQKQKGRTLLLKDDARFQLLQKLAADSYRAEGAGINYAAAEALVKPALPDEEKTSAAKVDHHTREFLGCSFLRHGPGDLYIFSHRSFRGYFAAKEIVPRLLDGSAKPQPLEQDAIEFIAEMMLETCTDRWYRQQVEAALKKEGLPDWIEKKNNGYFSKLPGGLAVEMVYVPAGPFVLGAEGELQPQIAVLDKGFWMDKTPVTNEQYQHFLKANPNHPAPNVKADWAKPYNWNGRDFPKGKEKHPVVLVSWNDAQAFCKWSGKVLPSDLQWEKSARGIDGRRYPWGSAWDRDKCNSASWWAKRDLWDYEKDWKLWWENEYSQKFAGQPMTTPVGQFFEQHQIESPYRCVDSAGNVWEWCEDFYDEQKSTRALRGGGWSFHPQYVECAFRYSCEPDDRYFNVGFRVART
jgi:formylglycine-generating enzyme required for sulfatase activity